MAWPKGAALQLPSRQTGGPVLGLGTGVGGPLRSGDPPPWQRKDPGRHWSLEWTCHASPLGLAAKTRPHRRGRRWTGLEGKEKRGGLFSSVGWDWRAADCAAGSPSRLHAVAAPAEPRHSTAGSFHGNSALPRQRSRALPLPTGHPPSRPTLFGASRCQVSALRCHETHGGAPQPVLPPLARGLVRAVGHSPSLRGRVCRRFLALVCQGWRRRGGHGRQGRGFIARCGAPRDLRFTAVCGARHTPLPHPYRAAPGVPGTGSLIWVPAPWPTNPRPWAHMSRACPAGAPSSSADPASA